MKRRGRWLALIAVPAVFIALWLAGAYIDGILQIWAETRYEAAR